MSAKTYSEKLRDPRWQKKRLEILNRAGFRCEECTDGSNTLHVHHALYIYGKEPWEYRNTELKCLCENCHDERGSLEHDTTLEWKRLCARLSSVDLADLLSRLLMAQNALDENPKIKSLPLELICENARAQ